MFSGQYNLLSNLSIINLVGFGLLTTMVQAIAMTISMREDGEVQLSNSH